MRESTSVSVANSKKALFWQSSWLDGQAPRDLAPNLYKLAWQNNNTIEEDMQNQNWTRGLRKLTTVEQMDELIIFGEKCRMCI